MKGETLALGVVGALAVAGVVSRRGSRARRWAYHLTYQSDLPSIAAKGLVPQRDTETAWGNEPGVYFVNVFGHEAGPGADPETTAWLRFPWPEDVPDGGRGMGEYRTLRKIPAATIEVFVSDGGFPTYEEGGRWRPLAKRGSAVRRPAWITPAFLRALRETEQTCIRDEGHTLVCREAVWAILERFPELGLWNEYGVYVGPGYEYGITHPEPPGYAHEWLRAPDGTLIDVATTQFGLLGPVVIPAFDRRQVWYLPEYGVNYDKGGYFLVGASKWTTRTTAAAIDAKIRTARVKAGNDTDYDGMGHPVPAEAR